MWALCCWSELLPASMALRQGFGLKHVSLRRGTRGYGFVIRRCTEKAPVSNPRSGLDSLQLYFVGDIVAGSNADKTDMHTGDRIVSVNGTSVTGLDNQAVLAMIQKSSTLNLLLIPSGEHGFSFIHSAYRRQPPIQPVRPSRTNMYGDRRYAYSSQQRLHSILEHGELALRRQTRFRSMVFVGSEHNTDGFPHMMETNGLTTADATEIHRKDSVSSDSSDTSTTCTLALRRANSDNIQKGLKLSLLSTPGSHQDDLSTDEINGANPVPRHTNNHTASTGCLPDSFDYSTSAKLTDHFPQKILTPSPNNSNQSTARRPSRHHSTDARAPVATAEDVTSPELDSIDNGVDGSLFTPEFGELLESTSSSEVETVKRSDSHSSGDSTGQRAEYTSAESSSNKIRFLPAYRAKTVNEMMQDRYPRAVRLPANNKPPSTKNSPNMATLGYNYSSSTMHPQQGRIYSTPPPQIRPYNTISRSRPNTIHARVNDGTHPRMPMRAVQPQTYHGLPVQPPHSRYSPASNYENAYATVRRSMPYAQNPPPQTMTHGRKANSHSDMRSNRSRMYSDNFSPPSQVDGRNIRCANSEPDIDQPRADRHYSSSTRTPSNGSLSIPSGQYIASSSMTSLPQYAQLMPPSSTPLRADSAGNVRRPSALQLENNMGTRHSYSAGPYQQKLSIPNQRVNSYDDVFNNSNGQYRRGNITPTSPVSRQPSYSAAMRDQVRPKYTLRGRNEDNSYSSPESVVLRNKPTPQTDEDPHQKVQRRTSYLMATQKASPTEETTKTPNQKYRILKKFFGEATPSIKEGQEKALQPYSQHEAFTLPENLEVQKTGILAVKILAIEGKRSNTRSWRGMGAVLSQEMLYLVKDKKENATMLTTPSGSLSIDEKPISIVACYVAIAHSYTKKRHVFKLITSTASEYLLQAEDDRDMVDWIRAIEANRNPNKESEQLTSAQLVKRINDQHVRLNQQKKRSLGGLSFRSKQPYASPSRNSDGTSKREKKRTSSGTNKQLQFDYHVEPASGDFGIPIHECSPSHENEFVPLVVELCTKAIEEKGLEFVGIYRVPGNKAAIKLLQKELNQGVINPDNEKWEDMNVLSSLLKTYFRQLPDSLITTERYKSFIETNRLKDSRSRLITLKQLIKTLPDYNFETLKYLAIHLRKVAEHGEHNKMDTRNLAIVFGPTIVKSGDDLSLVTDMSDQCRIIESIIIYCDWMFSPSDEDPPAIDEADVSSSVAPISETMNNLSAADLANLASNKTKSKAQLMSALSSAVSKRTTRSPISPSSISSPISTGSSPKDTHSTMIGDDHGFKNRDLQQEAAARNQRLLHLKEKELRDWHMNHAAGLQEANSGSPVRERYTQQLPAHPGDNLSIPRWHSEESVLMEHPQKITHDQYPYHANHYPVRHGRQLSNIEHDSTPPPPIPARGVDIKPPLPPKPMELYHAMPTRINSPEYQEEELPDQLYENYEHLQLEAPEDMPPQRTLRVIHNQLKTSSLPRRGSLDSMMDTLEPFRIYSSSSSTESQDGSDLLSSITETLKLRNLVDHKFQLQDDGRPKTGSDSSSLGSGLHTQRPPLASTSTGPSGRGSSEQSRESLLSILSNKENMNACESFSSAQDIQSSDRGFDGSMSSVSSVPYRPDAKVGIASRIERKDMKPMGHPPAANATQTRVVNATGSVISHRDVAHSHSSDEDGDLANNNSLNYNDTPLIQRHMSDEKKRVRRRHTVGGARDFELFKDMLSEYKAKQNLTFNEANAAVEPLQETLTAWQRLQPGGNKEPLSLRDWLERERFRASSPELEMHNMPNIMHLQKVGRKLSGSLLESNT